MSLYRVGLLPLRELRRALMMCCEMREGLRLATPGSPPALWEGCDVCEGCLPFRPVCGGCSESGVGAIVVEPGVKRRPVSERVRRAPGGPSCGTSERVKYSPLFTRTEGMSRPVRIQMSTVSG